MEARVLVNITYMLSLFSKSLQSVRPSKSPYNLASPECLRGQEQLVTWWRALAGWARYVTDRGRRSLMTK